MISSCMANAALAAAVRRSRSIRDRNRRLVPDAEPGSICGEFTGFPGPILGSSPLKSRLKSPKSLYFCGFSVVCCRFGFRLVRAEAQFSGAREVAPVRCEKRLKIAVWLRRTFPVQFRVWSEPAYAAPGQALYWWLTSPVSQSQARTRNVPCALTPPRRTSLP